MKTLALLIFPLLFVGTITGQTVFKSQKYSYSFTIPNGWRVKDQIIMPGTDAKIVDDRNNQFIVKVTQLPAEFKYTTIKSLLDKASDQELIELWAATYDNAYILKRGSTIVDGKEFYFVHMSCPFEGSLRLIHKMFMYNWKGYSFSINCASISSMTAETSVYFDVMLHTFSFPK